MFQETHDVFAALNDDAACAVYHRGQLVVDAHAGVVTPASLLLVASSTKFAESACIALLVDRGLLAYDDLIARHWPDFARGGAAKRELTVRDLMMHRAGLLYFPTKIPLADLADPARLLEHLETQPRRAEIAQGYHAITRGLVSGELLRRVDPSGRSLGRFFAEEIAGPFGVRLWIGLPEEQEAAVVALRPQPDPDFAAQLPYEQRFWHDLTQRPDSLAARTLLCIDYDADGRGVTSPQTQRAIRAIEMPSSNGVGTAEALARLATLVGARTPLFRRPETVDAACALRPPYAPDVILGTTVAFTQGGWALLAAHDADATPTIGWGGAGGSMVRFVPELDLAVAYVTRNLGVRMAMNDPRPNAVLAAAIRDAKAVAGIRSSCRPAPAAD
jgi:CubicO group peptidase (beta-lactamase class C family)